MPSDKATFRILYLFVLIATGSRLPQTQASHSQHLAGLDDEARHPHKCGEHRVLTSTAINYCEHRDHRLVDEDNLSGDTGVHKGVLTAASQMKQLQGNMIIYDWACTTMARACPAHCTCPCP
ncbi:unnamed protein product [Peniophora sp. CBMAI 1063]|nr:unnamed protein product [Peniophora sp. CBMAI 1063]